MESKAISNISKWSAPSEYRMWSNKIKNAYEHMRLYARETLQLLGTVKEPDILAELDVGPANMTAMEGIMEHLSMERANDMKSVGAKLEGLAANMSELNRDLYKREGEAWMKISSVRDEEGLLGTC